DECHGVFRNDVVNAFPRWRPPCSPSLDHTVVGHPDDYGRARGDLLVQRARVNAAGPTGICEAVGDCQVGDRMFVDTLAVAEENAVPGSDKPDFGITPLDVAKLVDRSRRQIDSQMSEQLVL